MDLGGVNMELDEWVSIGVTIPVDLFQKLKQDAKAEKMIISRYLINKIKTVNLENCDTEKYLQGVEYIGGRPRKSIPKKIDRIILDILGISEAEWLEKRENWIIKNNIKQNETVKNAVMERMPQYSIRCTKSERDLIKENAKKFNISISAYIREVIAK